MISDFASSISVKLYTQKHIFREDTIDLNCTSDSVPTGLSAEFVLNDETYTSLRKYNRQCYNVQQICSVNICSCSADNQSYFLQIKHTTQQNKLYAECSMNFGTQNIKDSILIHIVGKYVTCC